MSDIPRKPVAGRIALLLILLAIGLIFGSNWIATRRPLDRKVLATLSSAEGLKVGAKVVFLGMEIGEVAGIDLRGREIALTLAIHKTGVDLRRDDRVRLRKYGLLDDPSIEIVPGSRQTPPVSETDVLGEGPPQVSELDKFTDTLREIADAQSLDREKPHSKKPNVVVLIADDLGVGDLGFSGAKDIPTPRLDRLASEGVVSRHGYAQPMCAPTRVAFLTGRDPARIGFEDNRPGDSRHFGMDLSLKTVADVLRDAGYATGLIGKWHVGRGLNHEYSPWNRGFDEFVGYYGAFGLYVNPRLTRPPGVEAVSEGYSTNLFADEACAFLEKHKDRPFFLNVAFNAAHLDQVARPEDLEAVRQIADPKRRTAAAIVANLDANIGRIADKLRALDLDRRTLLVFFSDNGGGPPILGTMNGPYRGMKFDLYEGGIRVPFFARWPDGLPAGKTYDAPVSVTDLLPTLAAAAGAKVPEGIDGVDLLPHLRRETAEEPRRTLFWRTTEHAALKRMRERPAGTPHPEIPHLAAVRRGDWKLVVHDDAGPKERRELYHLAADPAESVDLAGKEEAVVRELAAELAAWRKTLKPQVIPPGKQ